MNVSPSHWLAAFGVSLALLPFGGSAAAAERRLPAFELKLLDGTVVRGKSPTGRVVIVDFWATWCQPCLAEIGDYNRFYREYGSSVQFLGIAAESGTEAEVRTAVKELGIEYPVSAPAAAELDVFGDISILPTTWIIDRDGTVVEEILGVPPDKQRRLRETVDRLLGKSP